MTGFDWAVEASLIAALLAAGVSVANVIMTARLSGRSESTAWARDKLPRLVSEFWDAATAMELEIAVLREEEGLQAVDDVDTVGMSGFAAMGAILEELELLAPAEVAYRAALYMDALDDERLVLLHGDPSRKVGVHEASLGRLGPKEEFLNVCRKTMGLDPYSTVGLNAARARAVSVHPRASRRHEAGLRRLQLAYERGPRWWRR